MHTRLALVAMTATLLTGCWPARFTVRPAVSGTVVSSRDYQPVPGARITVAPLRKENSSTAVADEKGRFKVQPLYDWRLDSFLGERWPLRGVVEIAAPGFSTDSRELQWPMTGRFVKDLGVISLTPSP
jgi:hypothetical protein